jgi:hypothetical protein
MGVNLEFLLKWALHSDIVLRELQKLLGGADRISSTVPTRHVRTSAPPSNSLVLSDETLDTMTSSGRIIVRPGNRKQIDDKCA